MTDPTLVERLRVYSLSTSGTLHAEAADRIEALEAENERLTHELLDERVRSGTATITTADDLRRMIAEEAS